MTLIKKNYVASEQRREEVGVAHFIFMSEIIMQCIEKLPSQTLVADPGRSGPGRTPGGQDLGGQAGLQRLGPWLADLGGQISEVLFVGIQFIPKKKAVRKDSLIKY